MAIDIGNNQLFNYLILIFKVREEMRNIDPYSYWDLFKGFKSVIEFKNKADHTPLLFCAAKN